MIEVDDTLLLTSLPSLGSHAVSFVCIAFAGALCFIGLWRHNLLRFFRPGSGQAHKLRCI
jgi:hypothetical protein